MFRRNKTKGVNAKFQDDMVSLTAPGALSSSGMEPRGVKKGMSGRFLGRRKKKAVKGNSLGGESAGTSNNNIESLGSNLQLQMQPQHLPESALPQSRNIPKALKKRLPSMNNVAVPVNAVTKESYPPPPPTRPQQQQQTKRKKKEQLRRQQAQHANILEMETRDDEKSIRSVSNIQCQPTSPPLDASTRSSNSNAPTANSTGIVPNVQDVAAAATAAVSNPPSTSLARKLQVGGSNASADGSVLIARSGWSVTSNASSAMNSEHYIQSLDNLPAVSSPKIRSEIKFPVLGAQHNDGARELSDDKTRAALSRQFGRNYSPQTFIQKWIVKVSPPQWHGDESRHKYKINITPNPSAPNDDGSTVTGSLTTRSATTESYSHLSFPSTTARRSLQDFLWLEQALRAEFHGALVVPLLSLALYFGAVAESAAASGEDESLASRSLETDATSKGFTVNSLLGNNGSNAITQSYRFIEGKMERNETVEENLLANWLSDIINGLRGNGEVILHSSVGIIESEAMETFLFRHAEAANGLGALQMGANHQTSGLGSPFNLFPLKNKCQGDNTMFEDFVENPFKCWSIDVNMDTVCGNDEKWKCSAGRTGLPGVENCTSYFSQSEAHFDFSSLGVSSRGIVTHSELLEAEKDLISSYIKSSSHALTKVQSLTKDEAHVGQCWKRFAISLSNLFSVEKDLEQAHIGDQIKSNKKNQPFRKLRKSAVDDALRILAQGKIHRSNPSLKTLQTMMSAFFADLNSVVPAFREYSEAMKQLHQLDDLQSLKSNRPKTSKSSKSTQVLASNEWPSSLQQLKALTWGVTQQITGGGSVVTNDSDPTAGEELSNVSSLSTAQTKAFQRRVLSNEKTLKLSITHICKASPLRNARMAWWYLKTEAKQALKVHTAASGLRQKLSIDAEAAQAMKERKYDADERKDNEAELKLVTRILDLVSSEDRGDAFDIDTSRKNAIAIAMEQVGRWNAKTALALMEAAGVADAEVQIDETSRELRHVRKYAISLRENVASCLEKAEELASSFILNSESIVQISRSRREFWAAVSVVFSGKIIPEGTTGTPSTQVLSNAGIDVTDRGGWLGHNSTLSSSRRNCGEAARQYLKKRDNQANILISRIVKLLKDYERRLEGIESFVYMHCVGIQLEKHCSRARSKALSAWEKRTDISTAINVATKKKIPKLVQELKVKLDALPQVSHTTVLKRKEEHLASKALKSDLHKLANRRFGRAQEVSTERVIAVMSLWAKHEESVAMEEVKALGEAVQEVELSVQSADVDGALDGYSCQ